MNLTVPIEQIVTVKSLDANDEGAILILRKKIERDGLKVPLLVSTQNILLDGHRRLEVLKRMNVTEVAVVVATDFAVACDIIAKARKHGNLDYSQRWHRVWELYRDTRSLMWDQIALSRQRTAKEKQLAIRNGSDPKSNSRELLTEALGLKSESQLQAITHVFLMAESDQTEYGDRARIAVAKLNAGQISPYMADGFLRRETGFKGDVKSVEDQRILLSSVTNTLSGIAKGFAKMGELSPDLRKEELNAWLTSLKQSRRELVKFVRLLEENASE